MPSGQPSGSELVERIITEIQATVTDAGLAADADKLRARLGRLLDGAPGFSHQPERRAITVLAAELRGFDVLAEQQAPAAVINLFNRYLAAMADVAARHGGSLDKPQGGDLIVTFGAPQADVQHAAHALACAAEMQQAMSRFNQQNEILQMPPLFMGIGIDSGNAVVGDVGSILRREYAALGAVAGVAGRLAAQSLRGQVLLSDAAYRLVRDFVLVGGLSSLRVRGRRAPVGVYELLGTTRPRALSVPRRDVRKSPRVSVQMPCYFQKVRGPNLLGSLHCGQVLDMGYNGIRMVSPVQLDSYSEVKMELSLQLLGNRTSDIYARVISVEPEQQGCRCSMEFVDIDVAGRQTIKQFVDSQVCSA